MGRREREGPGLHRAPKLQGNRPRRRVPPLPLSSLPAHLRRGSPWRATRSPASPSPRTLRPRNPSRRPSSTAVSPVHEGGPGEAQGRPALELTGSIILSDNLRSFVGPIRGGSGRRRRILSLTTLPENTIARLASRPIEARSGPSRPLPSEETKGEESSAASPQARDCGRRCTPGVASRKDGRERHRPKAGAPPRKLLVTPITTASWNGSWHGQLRRSRDGPPLSARPSRRL